LLLLFVKNVLLLSISLLQQSGMFIDTF